MPSSMTEPTEGDREMRKAFVEDTFPGCSQIDVGDYNLDALDRLLAAARENGRREASEECAKIADGYGPIALAIARDIRALNRGTRRVNDE